MPDIGLPELAIILVLILIVVGPKKLPGVGRGLGSGMREFKDAVTGDKKDDQAKLTQAQAPQAPVQQPVTAEVPVAQPATPPSAPAAPAPTAPQAGQEQAAAPQQPSVAPTEPPHSAAE